MSDRSHTALTWLRVLGRVAYTTLGNYLVGLTPGENHWRKGEAWSRVGAHRWAVWHFGRFLTYSDDPRVRAQLAWCYAELGMPDSAVQHYRQAYARYKYPPLALAQVETELGNADAARTLIQTLEPDRAALGDEGCALLVALRAQLQPDESISPRPATIRDARVVVNRCVGSGPLDQKADELAR